MRWLDLPETDQRRLFEQIAFQTGLLPQAVEKDAWVTLVLRVLFISETGRHLTFKGGTSLSKVYRLIKRFSEDIDLAIDREYLGFGGDLTKGKIRKLRRASHTFVAEKLPEIIRRGMTAIGVPETLYQIRVPNTEISDQDPEKLEVLYPSVFDEVPYLPSRVMVEMGARSQGEPFDVKPISSFIDMHYAAQSFAEKPFEIKVIRPERTFLEKLILLHEEFSKPTEKIRHFRMSRHYYDIAQILDTTYGQRALKDEELFRKIIRHRRIFTPVKSVDYDGLTLETLQIIPPPPVLDLYKADYKRMQETMIFGNAMDFEEILEKLGKIGTKK